MDIRDAESNGALMPDIASEAQDRHWRPGGGLKPRGDWHRRAVVHENHPQIHVRAGEGAFQVTQKLGCSRRIVIDRRDYNQFVGITFVLRRHASGN